MAPKDDIQDILQYYSKNAEDQRYQRHQLEFALTRKAFQAYLSAKPFKILEIGAGAGIHTEFLADSGHEVTVLEPTPTLVESNKKRIQSQNLEDRVRWIQADARDLAKAIPESEKFDVILNMGPFYHLTNREDRETVLKESLKRLGPTGLHWSVFLSRAGYVSYVLNRQPESLMQDPEGFRDIMTQGFFSSHPRDGTFRGYFSDLQELSELHQNCGMQIQKLHVLDPCVGGDDEVFNRLSEEQKAIWAEVLFALSPDSSFWGSGRTWLVLSQALKK